MCSGSVSLRRRCNITAFLIAALAFGSHPAGAQTTPESLPVGTRIMIQTTSGEFIDAKLSAADPDSILVLKGQRTIAIPVQNVQGVWTWRRDAIGGLKAGASDGDRGAVSAVVDGSIARGDVQRG